jgi:hypothetical protein
MITVLAAFPAAPPAQSAKLWRVIYDQESGPEEWNGISRTDGTQFSQLPAVYGYSPEIAWKPNDYHVDESGWKDAYYELNDYNIDGVRDGEGYARCDNFLFKGNVALYNNPGSPDYGFPRRELLTMSGNILQEVGWALDGQGREYLKFKTLQPGNSVGGMTHESHPTLVHRFMIVQITNNITVTTPKINRNGYLDYYLVSPAGVGYMPKRFVRQVTL